MLRHLTRIGLLAAALGAALAFSGGALAAPTTPQLFPIPTSVPSGDVIVKWTPSTFDAGFTGFYELTVYDTTSATTTVYITSATSQKVPVVAGHQYSMCIRAGEHAAAAQAWSGYDCEATAASSRLRVDIYCAWPPRLDWYPGDLVYEPGDAPIVRLLTASHAYRPYAGLVGVYIDSRGDATPILG
jgi:hypothetical protein